MHSVHTASSERTTRPFIIHRIPMSRPLVWLAQAWGDLRNNPLPSLAYGLLVTVMGAIILMFNNHPFMVAGSLTGFLLVGPIMTTGLCELSRRRERGEHITFEQSLKALHHNPYGLFGFANRLLALGVTWMLLSAVSTYWNLSMLSKAARGPGWGIPSGAAPGRLWGRNSCSSTSEYGQPCPHWCSVSRSCRYP